MNTYISLFGVVALALLTSGLPAAVRAENGGGQDELGAQVQVTSISGETVRAGDDDDSVGEEERRLGASDDARAEDIDDANDADEADEIEIELEDDDDAASSLQDLEQKIEERRSELDDEEASTTPRFRGAMKNANEVRLAVHALLASRELLGGIGSQVSEIAKHMNDSIATTTRAEAKIRSRGFLIRLFFGGDSTSAELIAREASRNQENIQKLTDLLGRADTATGVKAALKAQMTALEDAQARLKALAEKEQKAWGLFSWRF